VSVLLAKAIALGGQGWWCRCCLGISSSISTAAVGYGKGGPHDSDELMELIYG
jgi:hypothetical protein